MSENTTYVRGKLIHAGKANNVFATNNPRVLELEASDRVSAGNGVKKDTISGKGIANNQISSATFDYLQKHGIPTHYLGPGNTESSKFVKKAQMIPLEVIGRFKTAGSICKRYKCPEGIEFKGPFIEYTFKNDAAQDPPIDRKTIIALKILPEYLLNLIEEYTYNIAILLRDFYYALGVELVDFKIEYGYDCSMPGTIILCDEISPDTCRLVDMKTGEKLDKDRFRQDMGDVSKGYEEILKRVMQHTSK